MLSPTVDEAGITLGHDARFALDSPTCQEGGLAVRRRFCWPLFIPGLLQGKSTQVITPMLPLFILDDLHGSISTVGFVASAYSFSQVGTSVPMGFVLGRVHHRVAACACVAVIVVTALLTSACCTISQLLVLRVVSGAAANSWNLSRKLWLATEVPKGARGRISSTLTGMSRGAAFFAALLSGFVAQHLCTRAVFLVQASLSGCALLTLLSYVLTHERPAEEPCQKLKKQSSWALGLVAIVRETWYGLLTAGGFSFILNSCRQMWMVVLPLKGHALGLQKVHIGCVVAVSRAMDAFMSIGVTGSIADTCGRKASGVPGMVIIALSYYLVTASDDVQSLVIAAVLYGLGNGCTGGLTNTLSIDLAPEHGRAEFMGIWKMYTSIGSMTAPLLFGVLADVYGSLDQATLTCTFFALFGALWLGLTVRETAPLLPAKTFQMLG